MTRCLIKGLKVYCEHTMLKQAAVMIEDGIIQDVFNREQHQKFCEKNTFHFPANFHLIPGFIDLHIHGANGSDVMDATEKDLQNICNTLPKEGTTSFLATTMTQTSSLIEKALANIPHNTHLNGAEILGVHLEGPFLSPHKPGAHQKEQFIDPDIALFEKWQTISKNNIKLVTLDPERNHSMEFIKYLKQQNVIASIGHTNASFELAIDAINAGANYATHLFNAMTPIHQRAPGCSIAALLHPEMTAEIIADGVHLHPAMVHLAYTLKGADKMILVTDAIRAKCLKDGKYDLAGQTVTVTKEKVSLQDGTIAGSTLKMDEAFRNVYNYLKCPMEHVLKLCCSNPAKLLQSYHRKGSIAKGKDADLVVLDEHLHPVLTLCKGITCYEK